MTKKTFYEYFKESMDSLGLPAPDSLFNSMAAATATISAMSTAIKSLGAGATAAEIVGTATGATLAVDVAVALAGVTAAFYLGACIGALVYATQKVTMDHFGHSSKVTNGAWHVIHRATAMGIAIPDTVYLQMISPRMRNHLNISQSQMA